MCRSHRQAQQVGRMSHIYTSLCLASLQYYKSLLSLLSHHLIIALYRRNRFIERESYEMKRYVSNPPSASLALWKSMNLEDNLRAIHCRFY